MAASVSKGLTMYDSYSPLIGCEEMQLESVVDVGVDDDDDDDKDDESSDNDEGLILIVDSSFETVSGSVGMGAVEREECES